MWTFPTLFQLGVNISETSAPLKEFRCLLLSGINCDTMGEDGRQSRMMFYKKKKANSFQRVNSLVIEATAVIYQFVLTEDRFVLFSFSPQRCVLGVFPSGRSRD